MLQDWSGCIRTKKFMKSMHNLSLTCAVSSTCHAVQEIWGCDTSVGLAGFSHARPVEKAPHSAKTCPQATIDRISLSVCACTCACLCLRACTGICVPCMCQGQLFLLFLRRASGESPSSLSKRSFLQGTAMDCHRSVTALNKSFPAAVNTIWNLHCSKCLFV